MDHVDALGLAGLDDREIVFPTNASDTAIVWRKREGRPKPPGGGNAD
jgi:hypothetical protein